MVCTAWQALSLCFGAGSSEDTPAARGAHVPELLTELANDLKRPYTHYERPQTLLITPRTHSI